MHLMDLPTEAIASIFSRMDPALLAGCEAVCKGEWGVLPVDFLSECY